MEEKLPGALSAQEAGGMARGRQQGEKNGQCALCKREQGKMGYSREARHAKGNGAEAEHNTPGNRGVSCGTWLW